MIAIFAFSAFGQGDRKAARQAEAAKQAAEEAAKPKPAPTPALPTAKEILDKYIKALGGQAAIEKIKSRTSSGTVELSPMGIGGKFESTAAAPGRAVTKVTLDGIGEMVEGYDGKTAWSINPMTGSRDKSGVELAQMALANDFYRDLKLDKLYSKLEVKRVEKVNGKDAYVVEATAAGVPAETWFFDKATGLLVRSDVTASSPEGNQMMTNTLEEYKAVDGVMLPHLFKTITPQFMMTMITTSVKHNGTVTDATFAKPK